MSISESHRSFNEKKGTHLQWPNNTYFTFNCTVPLIQKREQHSLPLIAMTLLPEISLLNAPFLCKCPRQTAICLYAVIYMSVTTINIEQKKSSNAYCHIESGYLNLPLS